MHYVVRKKKPIYSFWFTHINNMFDVQKSKEMIYSNIMWNAHKIIFLEMSEWYSKYLIIPFFFRKVVETKRVSSGLLG